MLSPCDDMTTTDIVPWCDDDDSGRAVVMRSHSDDAIVFVLSWCDGGIVPSCDGYDGSRVRRDL